MSATAAPGPEQRDEAASTESTESTESTGSTASTDGAGPPTRRKTRGDIHVGSMGGDVKRVPGAGTENGDKAITDVMREVLDRVRRSIRERTGRGR
jgi:hypothetical protein